VPVCAEVAARQELHPSHPRLDSGMKPPKEGPMLQHVYPWWLGFLLVNPLRRLLQNPAQQPVPGSSWQDGPRFGAAVRPL
jgi:hypothetical protein